MKQPQTDRESSVAQHALIDTGVVYGAFQRRDQFHEEGLAIVQAADGNDLPRCVVLDFVLAETMNALTQELAYEETKTALSMLQQSSGLLIRRTNQQAWNSGLRRYESHAHFSLVDAILVAYAHDQSIPYLYSFDDGFDSVEGVQRLTTPTDPYAP